MRNSGDICVDQEDRDKAVITLGKIMSAIDSEEIFWTFSNGFLCLDDVVGAYIYE